LGRPLRLADERWYLHQQRTAWNRANSGAPPSAWFTTHDAGQFWWPHLDGLFPAAWEGIERSDNALTLRYSLANQALAVAQWRSTQGRWPANATDWSPSATGIIVTYGHNGLALVSDHALAKDSTWGKYLRWVLGDDPAPAP